MKVLYGAATPWVNRMSFAELVHFIESIITYGQSRTLRGLTQNG